MQAMGMIQTAAGLFAVAAVGGIVMAAIRMAGKRNPPHWLAMAHGFLAGAGLTLLVYAALSVGLPGRALTATVLFALAAGGGVVLNLAYQMKQRPLPVAFMFGHAALAVVALLLLLSVAFG